MDCTQVKRAVFVGSFDPVTLGHVDIIRRSVLVADQLVIGVHSRKPAGCMFSLEQRMDFIRLSLKDLPHVAIGECRQGIVNFARSNDADTIISGVRNIADFEHELHWSHMNQEIAPEISTMLLMADEKYAYLSSGIVREFLGFDKDISCFVPEPIAEIIKQSK